jgi:hypothetical protein
MNKESLEKVQEKVAELLNNTDIDAIDKVELLINLIHFLDPEKYEDNIKKLMKQP